MATTGRAALGAVVTRVPTLAGPDRDPPTIIRTGDRVCVDAGHGTVTARTDPAHRHTLPSTTRRRP
ncbi:hypothetical protein [Streptomyces sp. OE57]|uniref:hypothetical protein n=1 Tax=Streptomyces lacaronensis TaxID=3379885 RepID=UPI0039B76CA6